MTLRDNAARDRAGRASSRRSWTSTSTRTKRCSAQQIADGDRWQPMPIVEELKPKARAAGLWNLFLPESELRRRADQPRVRAALRDHGPRRRLRARSVQLLGARHRQHGSARPLRHAEQRSAVARAAARRRDPLVLRHDRARRRLVRRHQHPRRSIVRDGDDYVINGRKWWISGAGDPRCQIAIFMGKTDPDAPRASAAVDDPGADGRARRHHPSDAAGLRLRRCAARARGDHVRKRARAGVEHAARRRPRLRDRAGPARAGTHSSLHAARSAWPSARSRRCAAAC